MLPVGNLFYAQPLVRMLAKSGDMLTDLGCPPHCVEGLFGSLLLGKLFARSGALTLFDAVDCSEIDQIVSKHSLDPDRRQCGGCGNKLTEAFHMPFTGMWRSKELCGIFDAKSPLTGGLVEQGQVRYLLIGDRWKRRWLRRRGRGRGLGLSSWLRRKLAVVAERRACSSRHESRRRLTGTRIGLRESWGSRSELSEKAGSAGR